MRTSKTKSIILGNKDFGEIHKLLFLYTEEFGKITAIAKGARKITSKFTGHLETLNIAETSLYFGPKNIILSDISTIKNFQNIRKSYDKSIKALEISELTNRLIFENQSIDGLTNLMEIYLKELNTNENSKIISLAYKIKLLKKLGLTPDFKNSTSNKIEQKYMKFFNFIETKSIAKIAETSIKLSKKEEIKIEEIILKLTDF